MRKYANGHESPPRASNMASHLSSSGIRILRPRALKGRLGARHALKSVLSRVGVLQDAPHAEPALQRTDTTGGRGSFPRLSTARLSTGKTLRRRTRPALQRTDNTGGTPRTAGYRGAGTRRWFIRALKGRLGARHALK